MVLTDDKGVKVFRKDGVKKDGGSYSMYSLSVSSKDANGNWNNAYLDCAFKKGLPVVNNKAKIIIKKAFPMVKQYNGKGTIRWMITEMEIIEPGECAENSNGGSTTMDFMDIPDGIGDALPFE